MSASPTGLNMNWDGVEIDYTPTSGVSAGVAQNIKIGELTDVEIDGKSMQEVFYGDNRMYARLVRNTQRTRKIKLVGGNVAALLSIPLDDEVQITAYLNDAINGRGPGCIKIIAKRAKLEGTPFKGANNKFATSDATFTCAGIVAGDATNDTDPFTITVV